MDQINITQLHLFALLLLHLYACGVNKKGFLK